MARFRANLSVILAAASLSLGWSAPAQAGLDQTWVAAEGVDSGLCLIYLPCATLAFALDQTATGGTINVIDSGAYGAVTIDKAITIRSELGQPSMIASITVRAGLRDKIMISGIDLQGSAETLAISYPYGIAIYQAGDVLIHSVRIKDFATAGVYMNTASSTRVTVNESVLYNNKVGALVTGTNGSAHYKGFRSLYVANADAGVRVIGVGNDAVMAGNNMLGSAKSMDMQSGGATRSFGNNALTSGDIPIPMGQF